MFDNDSAPFRPPRRSTTILVMFMFMVITVSALVIAYSIGLGDTRRRAEATALAAASRAAARATSRVEHAPTALPPDIDAAAVSRPLPAEVQRRSLPVPRATIYLCRRYAGGSFWSDTTCHTQQATIDRMTSVPGDLPFQQQVAIASGQAREAARLYEAPDVSTAGAIGATGPAPPSDSECARLDEALRTSDAAARLPQPGWWQDRLRQERRQLQSRQFALNC